MFTHSRSFCVWKFETQGEGLSSCGPVSEATVLTQVCLSMAHMHLPHSMVSQGCWSLWSGPPKRLQGPCPVISSVGL